MMMNPLETTETEPIMIFSDIEKIVNQILIQVYEQGLTDLQCHILQGFCEGKTSTAIAKKVDKAVTTINNEAWKLYKLLNESQLLSESVDKGNLVSVIKRYKESLENDNNHHPKTSKQAKQRKVIILDGEFDAIDEAKIKAIIRILQQQGNDITIAIENLEEGSIKITISGSEEGLERLQELFDQGELDEIEGFKVLEVRDLTKNEQFIRAIKTGKVDKNALKNALKGVNLSGANLFRAYLSGADLSEANLFRAYLSGADLSGADLSGANLRGANLRGANLRGANLNEANLNEANLNEANLRGADLSRANLNEANLREANLSGANLSGANLFWANLFWANLSGADLSGANLILADLSGANVENAIFTNDQGITIEEKQDLINRGAIFDDPHARDRSKILV